MAIVCGVDCSTLGRPSWVAWLEEGHFILDAYLPTEAQPLPPLTVKPGPVSCYAFDAPQGLPITGETSRECDRLANAPTRRLPGSRGELERWRAWRGLIEVGISVFWWAYDQGAVSIVGLPAANPDAATRGGGPAMCETYPRYVIKRVWPDLKIPSKRQAPLVYVDAIYSRIQKLGFVCRSVARPTVDQVDAMVCALAARAFVDAGDLPAGTVGEPVMVDTNERVLRGGYILSP